VLAIREDDRGIQRRQTGPEGARQPPMDAAVIPRIPGAATHAPVIAIAERAVDLIRGVKPQVAAFAGSTAMGCA